MVLSLCGGSPGEKDELNPGNGSTGPHVAALAKATAADAAAEGRVEGASAQDDTHAAAEAALQVRLCSFIPREGGKWGRVKRQLSVLLEPLFGPHDERSRLSHQGCLNALLCPRPPSLLAASTCLSLGLLLAVGRILLFPIGLGSADIFGSLERRHGVPAGVGVHGGDSRVLP